MNEVGYQEAAGGKGLERREDQERGSLPHGMRVCSSTPLYVHAKIDQ